MLDWLRKRKRSRLLKSPFPREWQSILDANAVYFASASSAEQAKIRDTVRILVAEKNWEGCGGLSLTDEHRVTIAAQIARMTLGFAEEYFDEVKSILLYPDAYLAKTQDSVGAGLVVESQTGRLGEAWYRGPVILSWRDVLATGRRLNDARNVVIHEFAHQLDMRNGRTADGVPVIESSNFAERWLAVMDTEFERLRQMCLQDRSRLLDCYGTTNRAEFFAVVSEAFFEEPQAFAQQWPELFQILGDYYQPQMP